jgi:acetolactate decarboxylase
MRLKAEILLSLLSVLLLTGWTSTAQNQAREVRIVGQMKNVMWKGQLQGTISLDTIADKEHLYGLGPVENLRGEILILDGKSYKSTVVSGKTMKVEETYRIKAPFFGYTTIPKWQEQTLPDSIETTGHLEDYLLKISKAAGRPFMFRLSGRVEQATIHIVNLPEGTKVSSPDQAHEGKQNYQLKDKASEIIGFFSTGHKGVFTHHDTFLHMHLITADRQQMGHLDKVLFRKGTIKLYLPVE